MEGSIVVETYMKVLGRIFNLHDHPTHFKDVNSYNKAYGIADRYLREVNIKYYSDDHMLAICTILDELEYEKLKPTSNATTRGPSIVYNPFDTDSTHPEMIHEKLPKNKKRNSSSWGKKYF